MGGIRLLRASLYPGSFSAGTVVLLQARQALLPVLQALSGSIGLCRALPVFTSDIKLRRESPKLRLTSQKRWFGALKLMLSRRMDTYCIYDSTPSGTLNPRGERHGCGCESETMDLNFLINVIMTIVFFAAIFWIFTSAKKNQQKQLEALQAMRRALVPGDQVMTASGVYGTVVSTDFENNKLQLQIADGVVITLALNAIMAVVEEEAPAAPLTEDVYEAPASEAPASETSSDTAK